MILKNEQGREIELSVGGGSDDDIEITDAGYIDNGEDASDEDVDYLYENYPDALYEAWYQSMICRADFYERD